MLARNVEFKRQVSVRSYRVTFLTRDVTKGQYPFYLRCDKLIEDPVVLEQG